MEEKYHVDFIINTIIGILKHQKKGKFGFLESSFNDIFDKGQKIYEVEEFFRQLSKDKIIDFELYAREGYVADWSIEILDMKALVSFLDNAITKKNCEIKEKDDTIQSLINEKNEILSYNPEAIKESICKAKNDIKTIKTTIANTDLLSSLLPTIDQTEKYINSVSEINNNYVSIYKNIILPMQEEGKSGVKATVKWAIISITASAIISIIITLITSL